MKNLQFFGTRIKKSFDIENFIKVEDKNIMLIDTFLMSRKKCSMNSINDSLYKFFALAEQWSQPADMQRGQASSR